MHSNVDESESNHRKKTVILEVTKCNLGVAKTTLSIKLESELLEFHIIKDCGKYSEEDTDEVFSLFLSFLVRL